MEKLLSISSVSLPIALVGQIVEEWLNANRFRVAHRVTGLDVIDAYDPVDGVVHVDLALMVEGQNGRNGHGTLQAVETPQPEARPERTTFTEDHKAFIRDHTEMTARAIAEALGLREKAVAPLLTEARKALRQANATGAAPAVGEEVRHVAEPVREPFRGNGNGK